MFTDRQRFALLNPLGDVSMNPAPYRRVRQHSRGLLTTILAVDRQARLNDGLPVWHVSASLQRPGRFVDLPAPLEAAAIRLLDGVGGDREWWFWNPAAHVGHLRVPVTPGEYSLIPPGCVVTDAGVTGPERPRTRHGKERHR